MMCGTEAGYGAASALFHASMCGTAIAYGSDAQRYSAKSNIKNRIPGSNKSSCARAPCRCVVHTLIPYAERGPCAIPLRRDARHTRYLPTPRTRCNPALLHAISPCYLPLRSTRCLFAEYTPSFYALSAYACGMRCPVLNAR
eukprot:1554320-Rhodomonas_salina.2